VGTYGLSLQYKLAIGAGRQSRFRSHGCRCARVRGRRDSPTCAPVWSTNVSTLPGTAHLGFLPSEPGRPGAGDLHPLPV